MSAALLLLASSAHAQCRIDFGNSPDDFGQSNSCGGQVTDQYVNTYNLVFGTATSIVGAPSVRIDTDTACEPSCRSTGGLVGFTSDWHAQFFTGAGPGTPGSPAGVDWFSAELCFINAPPGTILMRAFNQAGSQIGTAFNSGQGTEVLTVSGNGQLIHTVRVEASIPEKIGGVSIDCLDYPDPQLLLACGDAAAGDCYAANGTPYCDDAACCAAVCAVDPSCCSTDWDLDCAAAAITECNNTICGSGGACFTPHGGQGCADAECCNAVCAIDPLCCLNAWDAGCAQLALTTCLSCGDPASGSCYAANGTPYCDDQACCDSVCAVDPSCCDQAWDFVCAGQALQLCGNQFCPGSGGCFVANGTPGCVNADCCDKICASNPACCLIGWDETCAAQASVECEGASCGAVGAGHCFIPNGPDAPYCDNSDCCFLVCGIDPFCCAVTWDALCVDQAFYNCGDCGKEDAGNCFESNGTPGCDDVTCCQNVCEIDTYCCYVSWDSVCVDTANNVCQNAPKQTCPQDLDGNGIVEIPDVNFCLINIGCEDPGPNADCAGDTDGDGDCDVMDLVDVIMHWGPCQE